MPVSASGHALLADPVCQAFRDNFKLTTWMALGALAQGVASLVLPARYALLPVVCLLLHRLVRTALMAGGVLPNRQMDGVVMGKFTAQIPAADGSLPTEPADQDVAVILLAARSNQCVAALCLAC